MSKVAKKLSGGEKRKLEIIKAIINEPDVIFLDESEVFLDEESFVKFIDF